MIIRSVKKVIQMLKAEYINEDKIDAIIQGVCIDSRAVKPGNLYVPIIGANNNGHAYIEQAIKAGAVATLWKKGEPNAPHDIPVIFVEDTVQGLQDLARAYRDELNLKIVGITGSNGKTSTKDILASVLAKHFKTQKTAGNRNSEIGVPLTLLDFDDDIEMGVVEMGMENLGELSALTALVRPDIAVITGVGTAHLENLVTMENIAKAKLEIVEGLPKNGTFIYLGDQKLLNDAYHEKELDPSIKVITFGEETHNDYVVSEVHQYVDGLDFKINGTKYQLDMLGKHQGLNATAAYIAAKCLGVSESEVQAGFSDIAKTGMRNELVKFNQCLILNDAYKSNPQSALAALDTMEQFDYDYKIAILGDMLELGETSAQIHYDLGKDLAKYHLNEVLTIGEMAKYINKGADDYLKDVKIMHFEDRESLTEYLKPFGEKHCMILFKGSRGMHLDLVVDALIKEGK